MGEGYLDTPHNFSEIDPYIIRNPKDAAQEILMAGKCFFYDACSFRKHLHVRETNYLFSFFAKQKGIVIITRGILMELASHSGYLNLEYIAYIKKMYMAGLKVFVIYEEDLFEVLNICFSANEKINVFLSWAVKNVKRSTGTIEHTLKEDRSLLNEVIKNPAKDSRLYARFFQKIRCNKETGDNLGEELLALCVHILGNIPEKEPFKYIVLTEDKRAIGLIGKARKNAFLYGKTNGFSAMTTNKLTQRLYEEKIINSKEQAEEILSAGAADQMVKIFASEKYDLEPKEKTMTCSELAEKIAASDAIYINF